MGLARCYFTCLISSITSERTEMLCSTLTSYQQHLRQKGVAKKLILTLRAIMISHEVDLVAGDFIVTAVAMSQQRQPQYY